MGNSFRGVESIKSTDFVIGAACRFCVLTHNLTHNRKRAGGGNVAESTIVSAFPEQKCPQSAIWRRFEGGVSVGKDEVPSSNLGSSSNFKHSNLIVWVLFAMYSELLSRFSV